MNKRIAYDFSYYVSKFLTNYLIKRRNASSHTILSYRDTFKLLIQFFMERGMKPEKTSIEMLNRSLLMDFLIWLQNERNCGIATQNQRLAGIHSFFRYVQEEEPKYLHITQGVLAIPYKKSSTPIVNYLSTDGIKLLLQQPDTSTKLGYRDFVLLSVMYDTGARVQEVADLTIGNLVFEQLPYIVLTGKGRKSRIVPLMKESTQMLRQYVDHFPFPDSRQLSPLFPNRNGQKISRAGISYILDKYISQARRLSPNLIPDIVTPHCVRHSKAMHLLQAGVNLAYIRDFLGHSDIKTTEIYARVDSASKRKALEKTYSNLGPIPDRSWTEDKTLMAWLKSL